MALSTRVVPCVVRGRPVGSWSMSSRTASLHRFSPKLVVNNLNCVVNISDCTSCWTVILSNNRVASLLQNLSEPVEMCIMLPVISGPVVFQESWSMCLILLSRGSAVYTQRVSSYYSGFAHLTSGKNATVFILWTGSTQCAASI